MDTTTNLPSLQDTRATKVAAYKAELAASLAAPPTDSRSPWSCTVSRMKRGLDGPVQDPGQAARRRWTGLVELAEWLRAESKIGPKHEQACLHAGVAADPGDTHKTNCAGVQSLIWDIDGAVDSPEKYAAWVSWLESKACHVRFSSASHDPDAGDWRPKAIMLLDTTCSYEEAGWIAHELRLELADVLGIDPTATRMVVGKTGKPVRKKLIDILIDPVVERAMQVELVPAWRDEARRAQAILPTVHHGLSLACAPRLERYQAHLVAKAAAAEAEAVAEVEREAAEEEARRLARESGVVVADDRELGLDDRQQHAADLLRRHGPAHEGSRGHDHAFGAVRIGVLCSLTVDEFWPLLRRWNATCSPPWPEYQLRRRLEEGYQSTTATPGAALRRHRTASDLGARVAAGGVHELDLDVAPAAAANDSAPPTEAATPAANCEDASAGSVVSEASGTGFRVNYTTETPCHSHLPAATLVAPRPGEGGHTWRVDMPQLPVLHTLAALPVRVRFLRSGVKTGKNYTSDTLIRFLAHLGRRVVMVVPSMALARTASRRTGLDCYLDLTGDILGSCVVCVDSVHRVKVYDAADLEADYSIALLVLDEAQQIHRHRVGGTVRGHRMADVVHEAFKELCQASERILAMDAGLDHEGETCVLEWLGKDHTWDGWERIINTAQPWCPETFWRIDESAHWRTIRDTHQGLRGKPPRSIWEFCSSFADSEAHGHRFQREFPEARVLVVNADTTGEPEVQAALADLSLLAGYDAVFHSPSIRCGVSVELEHVGWDKFAVFSTAQQGCGTTADDLEQALARVRDPADNRVYVCYTGVAPRRSSNPVEVMADKLVLKGSTAKELEGITAWRRDGHKVVPANKELLWVSARVEAGDNAKSQLADVLDEHGQVVEEGAVSRLWRARKIPYHSLVDVDRQIAESRPEEEVKAEKEVIVTEKESAMRAKDDRAAAAEHVSMETADELDAVPKTRESRAKITSARVRWRYGLQQLVVDDVTWDRKRGWERTQWFSCVVLAQRGHVEKLLEADLRAGKGDKGWVALHEKDQGVKGALLALLLREAGITDFSADALAGTQLRSLAPLLQARPSLADEIRAKLGITVTADEWKGGMALVGRLLRLCGLGTKWKQPRKNGRQRVHRLDPDKVAEMVRRSQAQQERILDPEQARKTWRASELAKYLPTPEEMAKKRAEVDAFVAAIYDFEYEGPAQRRAA